jgi:carbamate kinase
VARLTAQALLPLLRSVRELVITHGNGPVVGKIMMRQMLTMDRIPPMSMDICVAHSQGGIGYLLMQAMESALREAGDPRHVAALLTQVEVDPDDPAFANPTKFVGPFFSDVEASPRGKELGWLMREDSGRGWRHVVPSPEPKHICDISLVDELVKRGTVVIAGGGGGIPGGARRQRCPLRRRGGDRQGPHFGPHGERARNRRAADPHRRVQGRDQLRKARSARPREDRARRAQAAPCQGHFPPGSMGPKVDAAIRFIEGGGRRAIIGHLKEAREALLGEAGTHVVP